MPNLTRSLPALGLMLLLGACNPADQRPGLWLTGEAHNAFPDDWAFTRDEREIHLEVGTPYLLPHSVTIWCAESDGTLYVGARAPESKNWPGWVDEDPNVRLGIAGRIYSARLEPVTDAQELARVSEAYAQKYDLPGGISGGDPEVGQRYWRVTAPS